MTIFVGVKYSIWAPYEQAKTASRTFSFSRRYSQKTCVRVVISQKKVFRCVCTSNRNNLKILKSPSLLKKLCVRVVVDYADTRFSNFAIEYLRENEKFCETFLSIHMGPRSNLYSPKNGQKSRDPVTLKNSSILCYF